MGCKQLSITEQAYLPLEVKYSSPPPAIGYMYDLGNTCYINAWGQQVDFNEIFNNYIVPNSSVPDGPITIGKYTYTYGKNQYGKYGYWSDYSGGTIGNNAWISTYSNQNALQGVVVGSRFIPIGNYSATTGSNVFLEYADKTNNAVDAFARTLGTYGLTAEMTNTGRIIGRFSAPIGAAIGVGQTYYGFKKDGYRYGYNAQIATASTVGGLAGAWIGFKAGAWAGFELGFSIGLCFEGIGAIPGSVIGGIGGAFIGAWGGAYGGSVLGKSLIINKAP